MDAPFGILFLKKAELYTIINNLNKQQKEIEKDVDNKNSPSTIYGSWPVEKQILKWTYWGHKYLKHPIKVTYFTDLNRAHILKDCKLCINSKYKNKKYWLIKNDDKLKEEYQKIIGITKRKINGKEELFNNEKLFTITSKKEEKLNIDLGAVRHVLENNVVRGFSKPYYENSKKEKDKEYENLDGITINREGLLLGEVLYILEEKCDTHFIYSIYSHLMQHFGAWVLFTIFIFTLIITFVINPFNFWIEDFPKIIEYFKSLFQALLHPS